MAVVFFLRIFETGIYFNMVGIGGYSSNKCVSQTLNKWHSDNYVHVFEQMNAKSSFSVVQ